MGEVIVRIPDELEFEFKELGKEDIDAVFSNALRERLSERLMFKIADKLLKESKITDKQALEWGAELKERALKKH